MMQTSLPTLPQKITPFMRAVFCFLCIIISRLCYLQIKQWHYFKERSTKNFLRTERIPSLRGNIVDAHGTILATNRPVVDIVWHGTSNATLTTEQEKIIEQLITILNKENAPLRALIEHAEQRQNKITIARDISFEMLCAIAESWGVHPNITFDTHFQRHYPAGAHACHLVGYLGHINSQEEGIMGLERVAHEHLKGVDGTKQKTV